MWTRKGTGLVVSGVLLIMFSVTFESYLFLNLGTIMVAFVVINMLSMRSALNLEIERLVSNDRVFEGREADISIRITNRGSRAAFVEAFDHVPRQLRVMGGSNHAYFRIGRGRTLTFGYRVHCPLRGNFYFGKMSLRKWNIFSLQYFDQEKAVPTFLTVLPRVSEIQEIRLKSDYPRIFQGAVSKRQIGLGGEFHSIREYVRGDPFKNINWKAMGKTGKLMVNEFEREDVLDVMIVLDARACTVIPNAPANPVDFGARAAASLTSFFIKRRDHVGLTVYGDAVRIKQPESGERQLYEILNTLADARPRGNLGLKAVTEILIPRFTPRSPVIVISPLVDDDSFRAAIRDLVAHGFEVIVISPRLPDFLRGGRPLDEKLAEFERNGLISELRRYTPRVVDWRKEMPLSAALMLEGAVA